MTQGHKQKASVGNCFLLFLFNTLSRLHILCFIFHSWFHFTKLVLFSVTGMGKMHIFNEFSVGFSVLVSQLNEMKNNVSKYSADLKSVINMLLLAEVSSNFGS